MANFKILLKDVESLLFVDGNPPSFLGYTNSTLINIKCVISALGLPGEDYLLLKSLRIHEDTDSSYELKFDVMESNDILNASDDFFIVVRHGQECVTFHIIDIDILV